MRQRSISAVGVVFVSLIPALFGGPVFAAALTVLCIVGFYEYNAMARRVGNDVMPTGMVAVPLFGLIAALDGDAQLLLGVSALTVGVPFVWAIFRSDLNHAFVDWSLAIAGTFYLGLPLFAGIALRETPGTIEAEWFSDMAGSMARGWDAHPRGLAWLLVVILATWLSDTGAYLIGRAVGRRPLLPRISPKKTVEGLFGGLAFAAVTGAIAVTLFGLGIPFWAGLLVGLVVGAVGVIGDLAESLLKRQAGVKDSGTLIPGHGGMLDRLDALLFTLVIGWFIANLMDLWFVR